jgi:hypothetical protein
VADLVLRDRGEGAGNAGGSAFSRSVEPTRARASFNLALIE